MKAHSRFTATKITYELKDPLTYFPTYVFTKHYCKGQKVSMWAEPPITDHFKIFNGIVKDVYALQVEPRDLTFRKYAVGSTTIKFDDKEGETLAKQWGYECIGQLWAGFKMEIRKREVQKVKANPPYMIDMVSIEWELEQQITDPLEFIPANLMERKEPSNTNLPKCTAKAQELAESECFEDACKRIFGAKPVMKSPGKYREGGK